jgi:hypothetical protein
MTTTLLAAGLVVAVTALACGRSDEGPTAPIRTPGMTGLAVRIATLGDDVDADGYFIRVGTESDVTPVRVNDSVFLALPVGTYRAWLEDVAPNCAIDPRPHPRVTVFEQDLPRLDYHVRCWQGLPLTGVDDLSGTWHAVAWEFFRDPTFTSWFDDVIAEGLQGSLQIEQPQGSKELAWVWRETYPAWAEEYGTVIRGRGRVAAGALVGSPIDRSGALECDWGDCEGPLHGTYRSRVAADRLIIESAEPTTYYMVVPSPAWSRLTLIKTARGP